MTKQKLRHILYWSVVVVVFVPVVFIAGAALLAEKTQTVFERFRVWAYQERYIKPWERDANPSDLRGADNLRPQDKANG